MEAEIPPSFYESLRSRITSRVLSTEAFGKGCWEWGGTKKKLKNGKFAQYGTIVMNICGDRVNSHAHRASYIAFYSKFLLPYDISHCCHEARCVNPHHLEHEPHAINLAREECRKVGSCSEHRHEGQPLKSCIFASKEVLEE